MPIPEPTPSPPRRHRTVWIIGGLSVAALVMAGIAIGVAALNTAV